MSAEGGAKRRRGWMVAAALIISVGAILGYQGPHRVAIEKLQRRGVLVFSYEGSTQALAGIDGWALYQRWFPQERYVIAAGSVVFDRAEATVIYERHRRPAGPLRDRDLALLRDIPQARELILEGQAIGDAGLAHLRGHPGLAVLDLRRTGLTGASLPDLLSLPALRRLELSRGALSGEELATLKAARPGLIISFGR